MKIYNSDSEIIQVFKNELFAIKLGFIPSSGHKWDAIFNQNFIKEVEHKFQAKKKSIGAGGCVKFIFKAVKDGKCKIIMKYKRPWQEKIIKEQIFIVDISEKTTKMEKKKI